MKTALRIVAIFGLIACIGMIGCDSSSSSGDDGRTEFKNESSHTVTVRPGNGESFTTFVLEPNQSHKVDREGDNIDYTFSASGKVSNVDVTNIEVLFIDPINL